MNREAGILMPITSLPSEYGIGCFSQSAYDFVDWLKGAGQTYWQILPLGPTSYGDSPYQSFSTFAGNPYFISLKALIKEGVLTKEECDKADFGNKADDINYEKIYKKRFAQFSLFQPPAPVNPQCGRLVHTAAVIITQIILYRNNTRLGIAAHHQGNKGLVQ